MKLSLSVRVAESFMDKEKATLTIDELITLAKNNGYEAPEHSQQNSLGINGCEV